MSNNPKELATVIAAFLNKHGRDRETVPIDDYEFEVDAINDVEISKESINTLPDESVQFNGKALVRQHDNASMITTKVPVIFNGVAFFAKDISGDNCLLKVSIDRIIQSEV